MLLQFLPDLREQKLPFSLVLLHFMLQELEGLNASQSLVFSQLPHFFDKKKETLFKFCLSCITDKLPIIRLQFCFLMEKKCSHPNATQKTARESDADLCCYQCLSLLLRPLAQEAGQKKSKTPLWPEQPQPTPATHSLKICYWITAYG